MSSSSTRHKEATLQLHTVVDRPLTASAQGQITCTVVGMEPIEFSWYGPDGTDVQTDLSGSRAHGIVAGSYRMVATDANGKFADVTLHVQPILPAAVVVEAYSITHASTSSARDGTVTAIGHGIEDGWRFLWSHGYETDTPVLRDVPCGLYTACPLPCNGSVPTCIHQCAPARVMVCVPEPRKK